MSVNPFNIQTFGNQEVQTDGTQLDLSESLERGVQFDQAFQQYNPISAGELLFKQAATAGEKKISASEANDLYGVPNKLQFEEDISPSLAEFKQRKQLDYQARQTIIDMEADDNGLVQHAGNFLAIGLAAAGLDPLNYVGGIFTKPLAAAVMGIKAAKYSGAATKAIDALMDPTLFGSVYRTGFVKGAAGTLAGAGISEAITYNLAQEYGYDYDVLTSLAFMAGAGVIGGALGGVAFSSSIKGLTKDAFSNFDNNVLSAANRVDVAGFSVASFLDGAVDDIRLRDRFSSSLYETVTTRALNDLQEGRITSPKILNALLKEDADLNTIQKFKQAYEEGKYNGLISPLEAEQIIKKGAKGGLQDLDLSANLFGKLGLKIDSNFRLPSEAIYLTRALYKSSDEAIAALPKLETKLESAIQELNRLNKLSGDKLQASPEAIRGQAKLITELREKIEGIKQYVSANTSEAVQGAFSGARKSKAPEFMNFTEYLQEYQDLINKLGDTDLNAFLKLSDEQRLNIAKLLNMRNEFSLDVGDLNVFKTATIDQLSMSHNSHIFKAELNAFDEIDPKAAILEAYRTPELESILREQLRAKEFRDLLDSKKAVTAVDSREVEAALKASDNLDDELVSELKKFDEQAEAELNQEKGVQEILQCMINAI
jgi:hypothetical protein